MKIKNLIKIDKKINLPIIADCAEGFKYSKLAVKTNYVSSSFFQTNKLVCFSVNKPLYLASYSKNDK
ncbi:hypothetical protein ABXT06_05115 [Flavobacterium sp. UW10123]|uniref:hypothetical protein n=1 Tax=Flavobacterium sp. UW10123 TaxID=3230800 RepID=UPI003396CF78